MKYRWTTSSSLTFTTVRVRIDKEKAAPHSAGCDCVGGRPRDGIVTIRKAPLLEEGGPEE